MASNYPGSLDSFDTIASDKKTSDAVGGRTHRAMHNDLGDAIEAVQTELGATPSGSESTVAARLTGIENGTRLAANSVGATQLADSAVDTAAIADGAVTPAKLATTGRFTFPTGAANGYGFTSGAVHLSGTGAPEGVVTAPPGSTFLQTDSTVDVKGWIKWMKATGTGNTGWTLGPEYDSGWRDISALLANSWGGYLYIRRTADHVHFATRYAGLLKASATADAYLLFSSLDTGWKPNAASGGAMLERTILYSRNVTATALGYCYLHSSDGYFAAPNRTYDWAIQDPAGVRFNIPRSSVPTSLPGTAGPW